MNLLLAASNAKALWYLTRGTGVVSLLLLTAVLVLGVLGVTRWRSERWPRFLVAGPAPQPDPVRDRVRRRPRGDDRRGRLRADPARRRGRPVHLGVPADLARARRARLRPPARPHPHEPAARAGRPAAVARRALARLRGVAARARARARHRQRLAARLARDPHALLRRRGRRGGRGSPPSRRCAPASSHRRRRRDRRGRRAGARVVQIRPGSAGLGGTGRHADVDLAQKRDVGVAEPCRRAARRPCPASFDGKLTGRIARNSDGAGNVGIAIGGNVTGGAVEGVLKLTLWGSGSDGGVAMTDSRVTFQPVGIAGSYSGQVVGLDGNLVQADVTNSAGDTDPAHHLPPDRLRDRLGHRDGARRVSATRVRPEPALVAAPQSLPRLLAGIPAADRPVTLDEHLARYGSVRDGGKSRNLIDLVEASGLQGRGGAAFPTATKLRAVASRRGRPVVVVNGTEGEPASGKDKVLLRCVPAPRARRRGRRRRGGRRARGVRRRGPRRERASPTPWRRRSRAGGAASSTGA